MKILIIIKKVKLQKYVRMNKKLNSKQNKNKIKERKTKKK